MLLHAFTCIRSKSVTPTTRRSSLVPCLPALPAEAGKKTIWGAIYKSWIPELKNYLESWKFPPLKITSASGYHRGKDRRCKAKNLANISGPHVCVTHSEFVKTRMNSGRNWRLLWSIRDGWSFFYFSGDLTATPPVWPLNILSASPPGMVTALVSRSFPHMIQRTQSHSSKQPSAIQTQLFF